MANGFSNIVNGLITDPILKNIFKNRGSSMDNGLSKRPIGLVSKSYDYIRTTLNRNIGTNVFGYDGYGTVLGTLADVDNSSNDKGWFHFDIDKKRYDNYMRYVNATYFNGHMPYPNFVSDDLKSVFFDRNSLLFENNHVGAVRGYDIFDNFFAKNLIVNGAQTSVNGGSDTRLGVINNFYLNATLTHAHAELSDNGGYIEPYNTSYLLDKKAKAITQGAYHLFGYDGEKGLINGLNENETSLLPQNALTDSVIRYTPVYSAFGEYKNMISSQDLVDSSSYNTRQFIIKSILGYNLLDSTEIDFDTNDMADFTNLSKKKYYVVPNGNSNQSTDYISSMVNSVKLKKVGRFSFNGAGNGITSSRMLYVYAENENGLEELLDGVHFNGTYEDDRNLNGGNEGIDFGHYVTFSQDNLKKNDLLKFTNTKFRQKEYDTLIARFHTDKVGNDERDYLNSAISKQYGMSHGRNLLKKDHLGSKTNTYSDPYCRVWTYHKQYHRLVDMIRPLYGSDGGDLSNTEITSNQPYRSRLSKHGVKDSNSNRLVRIAPTAIDNIKNCMFSIENLAWKNERNELDNRKWEKGPLGGRIMWFPPYGLSFSENVNVNWNPTQFIGRGENIYTYTNTERSGTLKFKLLIDHPSLLNNWSQNGTVGDVDDVDSTEQKILRFFAGCEILAPNSPKEEKKVTKKQKPVLPQEPKKKVVETPKISYKEINFYIFYPNNYTGINDDAYGKVRAMEYIANGVGTQYYESTANTANPRQELPTTIQSVHVGYEMGRGGISKGLGNTGTSTTYNDTKLLSYPYINKIGKINQWGYRVDKRVANEVFRNANNYCDSKDFSLNNSGYEQLVKYHTDAQAYVDDGSLFSFADVFMALEPNANSSIGGNSTNIDVIRKLIETFDPIEVIVDGFASSHGTIASNNILNKDRATSIMAWLNKCNPHKFPKKLLQINDVMVGPKISTTNVSDIEAKVWRCAKVCIKLSNEALIEKNSFDIEQKTTQETISSNNALYEKEYSENVLDAAIVISDSSVEESSIDGYGAEYKFFKDLEKEDTFLHHRIVDKIKYFDPAYHSITPEGFNARLTFLQQCTRQGSTIGASDSLSTRSASNLAFGSPPICVLRIGDFYNTKILIESLHIEYVDDTWDLNDEGIGIMPMMADIDISFKFLGGSDLEGPIARLQNAVSFNYYANTGVYDGRAEMVKYDNDGKLIDLKKIGK